MNEGILMKKYRNSSFIAGSLAGLCYVVFAFLAFNAELVERFGEC